MEVHIILDTQQACADGVLTIRDLGLPKRRVTVLSRGLRTCKLFFLWKYGTEIDPAYLENLMNDGAHPFCRLLEDRVWPHIVDREFFGSFTILRRLEVYSIDQGDVPEDHFETGVLCRGYMNVLYQNYGHYFSGVTEIDGNIHVVSPPLIGYTKERFLIFVKDISFLRSQLRVFIPHVAFVGRSLDLSDVYKERIIRELNREV